MAKLLRELYDNYRDLMDNQSDQRVKDWPLLSSPFPTLAIVLSYVYFVKVWGPKWMENRKPFDLRRVIIVYNLVQVIFSIWIFKEAIVSGWGGQYSFRCQPIDYSNDPMAVRMAEACWWYYFAKFTELLDTIFFVLRKKNNQISTLHVIHHGCMPMSVWFGVKFTPGGHSTFFGMLNTFVHIVMYTYYLLAALGPKVQPYLWWKRYLTLLQIVQFVLMLIHTFQLLFIECDYPRSFVWFIGMHAAMFLFLFSQFYKQTYTKKQIKAEALKKKNDEEAREQKESTTRAETNENGAIYANQYKMATGYISDSGLRNRVFIDNRGFKK
ncbi:very long chain fatty acid elongase AAEL008004 [Nomia melanderi]|uniref:very long chain fatty acid elongase AAEL008004 n=1 Tax=Nomia melanderi TaxID=2448451 RepID=UPI0013046331|nr:elongation of very long chain fatty acids protein AAEL008004-like [Nomia melanderi]XP_031826837.1 elongation of very long chain fatty acids protein AAEL008004-like [Nomia melanderi]